MSKGVNKKFSFSDELQAIGAKKKGTRADAVKAIWDYAKSEGLNETKKVKGRNMAGIKPDEYLADVFGSSKWHGMGDIARAVSANLLD
jgi:chromatin remodeling complex protein RSC6